MSGLNIFIAANNISVLSFKKNSIYMSKSNKTLMALCLFITTSIAWFACHNKTMGSNTTGASAQAVIAGTKPDTTVTGTIRFTEKNGKVKMFH